MLGLLLASAPRRGQPRLLPGARLALIFRQCPESLDHRRSLPRRPPCARTSGRRAHSDIAATIARRSGRLPPRVDRSRPCRQSRSAPSGLSGSCSMTAFIALVFGSISASPSIDGQPLVAHLGRQRRADRQPAHLAAACPGCTSRGCGPQTTPPPPTAASGSSPGERARCPSGATACATAAHLAAGLGVVRAERGRSPAGAAAPGASPRYSARCPRPFHRARLLRPPRPAVLCNINLHHCLISRRSVRDLARRRSARAYFCRLDRPANRAPGPCSGREPSP